MYPATTEAPKGKVSHFICQTLKSYMLVNQQMCESVCLLVFQQVIAHFTVASHCPIDGKSTWPQGKPNDGANIVHEQGDSRVSSDWANFLCIINWYAKLCGGVA